MATVYCDKCNQKSDSIDWGYGVCPICNGTGIVIEHPDPLTRKEME